MDTLTRVAYRTASALHRLGVAKWSPISVVFPTIKRLLLHKDPNLSRRFLLISHDDLTLAVPADLVSNYVLKDKEPLTQQLLKGTLVPGAVVVDIGANIGYYTLMMAKLVGSGGKVYAIEPGQDNLQFLRRNVEKSGFSNVEILPHAAGARRQIRSLYLHKTSARHSLYPSRKPDNVGTCEIQDVEEIPLDEVIEHRVDIVKIDVEGAEIDVLKGMKRILQSNPEIQLFIEWNPLALEMAGHRAESLPEFLLALGFELSVIDDRTRSLLAVEEMPPKNISVPSWWGNIYARRAGHGPSTTGREIGGPSS